ncbi:unnamed protein product [Closterium sp. Naga37s-1]|nr:unnamed protein product [Closterium sp. Naga37s-1]
MAHARVTTRIRLQHHPLFSEPPAPRAFAAAVLAAAIALLAAAAAAGVTVRGAPLAKPACVNEFPSEPLCRFVDDLAAAPRVEVDASTGRTIRIGAYQIYQKLHRDLPPTKLYAYGPNERTAHYPGPTLVARRGIATKVRWKNHLRDRAHMFAVDYTLMDVAHPKRGSIPIGMAAATLWYHDHAVGITWLNVAAGMAGLYVLTDPKGVERKLRTQLPGAEFTVPLAISDRSFFANGSIDYPSGGWEPEYLGNTILVSGLVWPFLAVRRARYRFRVLGAASSRFFNLRFVCAAPSNYPDFTLPITGDVLPIVQIGTDGGYLPRPVIRSSLLLAPGERHDILVDFASLPASCADVILTNKRGSNDTGVVMRFIVDSMGAVVPSPPVPKKLVSLPKLHLSCVSKERWMTAVRVNSSITFDGHGFSYAPTETPKRLLHRGGEQRACEILVPVLPSSDFRGAAYNAFSIGTEHEDNDMMRPLIAT